MAPAGRDGTGSAWVAASACSATAESEAPARHPVARFFHCPERYRSLASMYYRGTKAAVVVYDITSESSFKGASVEGGILLATRARAKALEGRRVALSPLARRLPSALMEP